MNNLKLSVQARASLMMVVTRAMLNVAMDKPAEECDADLMLRKLNLYVQNGELFVENPPAVETPFAGSELGEA